MNRVATICRPRLARMARNGPGVTLLFQANSLRWSETKNFRQANAGVLGEFAPLPGFLRPSNRVNPIRLTVSPFPRKWYARVWRGEAAR